MKEEEENVGRNEYKKLSPESTTDYVVMDKDYYQDLNQKLTSILIGTNKKSNPNDQIKLDFEDIGNHQ